MEKVMDTVLKHWPIIVAFVMIVSSTAVAQFRIDAHGDKLKQLEKQVDTNQQQSGKIDTLDERTKILLENSQNNRDVLQQILLKINQ